MSTLANDKWTFGIITAFLDIKKDSNDLHYIDDDNIKSIISSIYAQDIPLDKFEIIIVGANSINSDILLDKNIYIKYFDEGIKNKWITRKKNIIFEAARFENIMVTHDYFALDLNWYKGFQQFETSWDVCMVKIHNKNGIRWRDWLLWWDGCAPYRLEHNGVLLHKNRLSYDDNRFTNTDMYISGSVIIGKREFLINNKLNEDLCWGQGEDCEWSQRCRPTWIYKMNTNSTLRMLKQHEQ